MKIKTIIFGLLAVSLSGISVKADINSTLATWNAMTISNAQFNNEYEGAAFVGGNLTGLNTVANNGQYSASTITLAVQGNVTSGNYINVNHGSVAIGGTSSANYNMNSGGTLSLHSPVPASISPISQVISSSLYWSTLTGNSTITTNNANQITFNATVNPGQTVAVFNVTGNQTFGAGLNGFNLSVGAGVQTVLVNVNAGSINWTSGNFFGEFQQDFGMGNVLFNFYNATNIYLGNQFQGYLVAPNANVTAANNIDGGVMASNLVVGSEVHLPDAGSSSAAWYGTLPTTPSVSPVPEPTTLALIPAGIAALWSLRRRSVGR